MRRDQIRKGRISSSDAERWGSGVGWFRAHWQAFSRLFHKIWTLSLLNIMALLVSVQAFADVGENFLRGSIRSVLASIPFSEVLPTTSSATISVFALPRVISSDKTVPSRGRSSSCDRCHGMNAQYGICKLADYSSTRCRTRHYRCMSCVNVRIAFRID
jgi:hypothetical protein